MGGHRADQYCVLHVAEPVPVGLHCAIVRPLPARLGTGTLVGHACADALGRRPLELLNNLTQWDFRGVELAQKSFIQSSSLEMFSSTASQGIFGGRFGTAALTGQSHFSSTLLSLTLQLVSSSTLAIPSSWHIVFESIVGDSFEQTYSIVLAVNPVLMLVTLTSRAPMMSSDPSPAPLIE